MRKGTQYQHSLVPENSWVNAELIACIAPFTLAALTEEIHFEASFSIRPRVRLVIVIVITVLTVLARVEEDENQVVFNWLSYY